MKLGEFRNKPGTKLRTEFATPIMVLRLCAGMISAGATPSGGQETVAVVNLQTGHTYFEGDELEVVAAAE